MLWAASTCVPALSQNRFGWRQVIYSGGMDVDILPQGASKGAGRKFRLRAVCGGGAGPPPPPPPTNRGFCQPELWGRRRKCVRRPA